MKTQTETTLAKPAPISPETISRLINEKGIMPEVASIDLEMVKMKLALSDEGEGWPTEKCEEAEVEYKRFLHLSLAHRKTGIVPTDVIDTMWHYHILDTRAYHKDCERVLGGYFHHFPYFGLRGDEDKKDLENAFEKTKVLYVQTFSEPMLRSKHTDCWHECQGQCWHSCSNEDHH